MMYFSRMERGDIVKRRLDRWVGIPLVCAVGGARSLARRFDPVRVSPENIRSAGVLALGAIGDLLLAGALINGLRRELPHAAIDVITTKANAACHGFLPGVSEATAFAITDIPGMIRQLRSKRYDVLIDTGQWARFGALLAACSGATCTIGFATEGQYRHYAFDLAVPHRQDRHETDNFLALGRALFPNLDGTPSILIPAEPSRDCPRELLGARETPLVFCHMWPSGLHAYLKEWPEEYWAELAVRLADAGYTPVFTGGPRDAAATEKFLSRRLSSLASACSVAGRASLADISWAMHNCAAVVSVNTGIMHLAAIAGAATVALNGPTNPLRWGPVGKRVRSLQPRGGHYGYLNLGFEYPEGAVRVLDRLPVEDVIVALRDLGLTM